MRVCVYQTIKSVSSKKGTNIPIKQEKDEKYFVVCDYMKLPIPGIQLVYLSCFFEHTQRERALLYNLLFFFSFKPKTESRGKISASTFILICAAS